MENVIEVSDEFWFMPYRDIPLPRKVLIFQIPVVYKISKMTYRLYLNGNLFFLHICCCYIKICFLYLQRIYELPMR